MCSSKCFAKPQKMSLLDILTERTNLVKASEKLNSQYEITTVKLDEKEFEILKDDLNALRKLI